MWYLHAARMFYKERDLFEDLSGLAHKETSNLTAYKIHVVSVLLQLSASKWHREEETVSLRGKSLPSSKKQYTEPPLSKLWTGSTPKHYI